MRFTAASSFYLAVISVLLGAASTSYSFGPTFVTATGESSFINSVLSLVRMIQGPLVPSLNGGSWTKTGYRSPSQWVGTGFLT